MDIGDHTALARGCYSNPGSSGPSFYVLSHTYAYFRETYRCKRRFYNNCSSRAQTYFWIITVVTSVVIPRIHILQFNQSLSCFRLCNFAADRAARLIYARLDKLIKFGGDRIGMVHARELNSGCPGMSFNVHSLAHGHLRATFRYRHHFYNNYSSCASSNCLDHPHRDMGDRP